MVDDGKWGKLDGDSFVKPGSGEQNFSLNHSQVVHRSEGEKSLMETEERGFSDLYRNTSEEIFLKSLMESSIGLPVPTMEMLGFKNLSQSFRTDSEELFKTWLTNGEASYCIILMSFPLIMVNKELVKETIYIYMASAFRLQEIALTKFSDHL